MPIRFRQLAVVSALVFVACNLGGCSTINGYLVSAVDYLPQWAGGMPADVPPRPGSAKYDEFMKERERKRLEPAPTKEDAAKAPSTSSEAIY